MLHEAKVLIERWRSRYSTVRPHGSLGHRPQAPEAIVTWTTDLGAAVPRLGIYGRGGRGTNMAAGTIRGAGQGPRAVDETRRADGTP
jgi:hypothetical protein